MLWKLMFLWCALLCTVGVAPLWAEETYAVNSESVPLNVRSGPGVEHSILTRLPHGTRVVLRERSGLWAKIVPPNGPAEGWVLERYLVPVQTAAPAIQGDVDPDEEQRRFTRLQRKGVITAQRLEDIETLRLTINPLLWYRLTAQEQHNFLQRARQVFGGTVVEIYAPNQEALLARLSATGTFEAAVTSPTSSTPQTETAPAPPPPAPNRKRQGR